MPLAISTTETLTNLKMDLVVANNNIVSPVQLLRNNKRHTFISKSSVIYFVSLSGGGAPQQKLLMANKSGLFLTNILSKLYEKVLDLLTTEKVQINEHVWRTKRLWTVGNMIMMRAVIDNNRRLNRKTYCYFADAYKCFDKLCLKDCLVELWNDGEGSLHVI